MEAVITIDVLRRAGADVTVASVEKQLRVDACHGIKIVADALITDISQSVFDLITLPVCNLSLSIFLSLDCLDDEKLQGILRNQHLLLPLTKGNNKNFA